MAGGWCFATALLLLLGTCYGQHWLMEGDFVGLRDAGRLQVRGSNMTINVSSSLLLSLTAPEGYEINCVMAAALRLNGHVSIVEGGVGSGNVSVAYRTIAGLPDQLFVSLESHVKRSGLRVHGEFAETPRVTIVFNDIGEWSKTNETLSDDS